MPALFWNRVMWILSLMGPVNMFPALLDALENNKPYELIKNLVFRSGEKVIKTAKEDLFDRTRCLHFL